MRPRWGFDLQMGQLSFLSSMDTEESLTPTSAATGNISGMALAIPVNGTVSSRFGSRSSSRSSSHTGLDICTSTVGISTAGLQYDVDFVNSK